MNRLELPATPNKEIHFNKLIESKSEIDSTIHSFDMMDMVVDKSKDEILEEVFN